MLSYRHLFHAGNPADVFKHSALALILEYLKQKDAPFVYVDTHASTGSYNLQSEMAQRNVEYEHGIIKILADAKAPDVFAPYLACVRELNGKGTCTLYPGSVAIAASLLRDIDRAVCYELHPRDYLILERDFAARRFQTAQQDGLAALKALLPPPERRALIMIDPSYELKTDYDTVLQSIALALKKFATGVYVLWYPLLDNPDNIAFRRTLAKMTKNPELNAIQLELPIKQIKENHRLNGSGLFIINPPYILPSQMEVIMPYLTKMFNQ